MAAVDPYSPCPCGSGQKFKWCCHKVEAVAERADRLFHNGQGETAVQVLDEGLRKEPGNAWLLSRKAVYLYQIGHLDAAMESARLLLKKHPRHFGALFLLTQLRLQAEGPAAGVAQLQEALAAVDEANLPALAGLFRVVGAVLARAGEYAGALRHLKQVDHYLHEKGASASLIRSVETNQGVVPWLKNPDALSPPDRLTGALRERFVEALTWAEEGRWSAAAAAFELLSADPEAALEADRNLGLCRLWLLDDAGAIQSLRRAIARLGTSSQAVDLEALCQCIVPPGADEMVELVELTWPLRNRPRLLETLRADPTIYDLGQVEEEEEDEAPGTDQFALLDRPRLERTTDLKAADIPRMVGQIFVEQDVVMLETYDDGRLDALVDRVTALAEGSIAPAHPKTKVTEQIPRVNLALHIQPAIPAEVPMEERTELLSQLEAAVVMETWPKTPMPYLKGRTPIDAARAGDAQVPLRAAVMRFERESPETAAHVDFQALRGLLHIEPEPAIDPSTVDIDSLHVARLSLVPADRLDDFRLAALYRRGQRFGLLEVIDRAARVLVERPHVWAAADTRAIDLYAHIALRLSTKHRKDEALDWLKKGREAEPAAQRAEHTSMWDMLEIRVRALTEDPASWVPELAIVLERYSKDPKANEAVVFTLLEMGLLRAVPHPEREGEVVIDSRMLQAVLAQYGPRVTTAAGGLGVSAARGEIWTPGGPAGGGGGGALWTPGASAGAGGTGQGEGKSKLIIPGR